jgi:PIN domain nuclease of toxin-antitoxin system
MKYLLDTHTFIWYILNNPKLSEKAVDIISNMNNEIYFSAVSGWEMIIKAKIGKLQLPDQPAAFIIDQIKENGFTVLPVFLNHSMNLYKLPDYHKDPFDRMLISQATTENIPIITIDKLFQDYPVKCIW